MGDRSAEVAPQADNLTQLAKEALNSDSVDATRSFLEEVNKTSDLYAVSQHIEESQSGPIDAVFHAFSDDPTFSWKWDSHPMGRWASELKFQLDGKEIRWDTSVRNLSKMTDEQVASFEVDTKEERRLALEGVKEYERYVLEATEQAGDLSTLAKKALESPDSQEAKQALLDALKKTDPLTISLGINELQSGASGIGRSFSDEPKIECSTGSHPLRDWTNYIKFEGKDSEITWKPGDSKIEVKPKTVDI